MKLRFRRLAGASLLLLAVAGTITCAPQTSQEEVVVFGAASLRDALVEVGVAFRRETSLTPVFSFAGSNVLARQLEAAPLGDVFLSANERWMDFLEERGLLVPESRRPVLSNELALIIHRDAPWNVDGVAWLGDGPYRHLALADPDSVPAGQYAKGYLQAVPWGKTDASLWQAVAGRVAPAANVRAALALVEADPEIVGMVYQTDAQTSDRVRIAHRVAAGQAPRILYPAAAIAGSPNPAGAGRFLEFLSSEAAGEIFAAHGFAPVSDGMGIR
ncbi:MAG: molybdate ABC transporter substrate-binding protein [Acidobacteriota bacterium]